jgi:hypothetical protein
MQQERAVYFTGGALGQFFMHAVKRVSGLKGDYVAMTQLCEPGTGFRWRQTQI